MFRLRKRTSRFDFTCRAPCAQSTTFATSSLVIAISGWVLAEFVRLTFNCPPAQAQLIVDSLADRRIPLVWQQGNIIRVLDPALGFRERTLAVLYHLDP